MARLIRYGRRVATTIGVSLLLLGVRYGYWVAIEYRVAVVESGRLLQSARIPPAEIVDVIQSRGVTTVIDLRRPEEGAADQEAERRALEASGISYVRLPTSHTPTEESVRAFITACEHGHSRGGAILVHCHHGEGRSVLFGALYRVRFMGWTPDRACAAIARLPEDMLWVRGILPRLGGFDVRGCKARLLHERCADSIDRPELAQAVRTQGAEEAPNQP